VEGGGAIGEGTVLSIAGGALGITSVGGGSLLALAKSDRPASGWNGAERIAPSTKQKLNESSNVRLHSGQLFITLSCF
jgi:hypothetical protein